MELNSKASLSEIVDVDRFEQVRLALQCVREVAGQVQRNLGEHMFEGFNTGEVAIEVLDSLKLLKAGVGMEIIEHSLQGKDHCGLSDEQEDQSSDDVANKEIQDDNFVHGDAAGIGVLESFKV